MMHFYSYYVRINCTSFPPFIDSCFYRFLLLSKINQFVGIQLCPSHLSTLKYTIYNHIFSSNSLQPTVYHKQHKIKNERKIHTNYNIQIKICFIMTSIDLIRFIFFIDYKFAFPLLKIVHIQMKPAIMI